jgi:hypothetical protein
LGTVLSLPPVQSILGKYATDELNKAYGTDLTIEQVAITPFGSVKLKGILILDHHKDTLFAIKRLNTSILSFSKLYDPGHPYLKDVILDGLDAKITNYKNEDYTNLDRFIDAFDDGSPSSGKFRMRANKMTVFSSRFRYIDENLKTPKVLDLKRLNGKLEDFLIKGPNVTTIIDRLAFKDHRGIEVTQLTAGFTYTKTNILLDHLTLQTTHSELKGKVELRYKREDFKDFNNKVIFDVQLDKAAIASNDLNCFYNEFGKHNMFYLDTHFLGTLNNFTLNDLQLLDKNQSEIIGSVTFKNLFGKDNQSFYMKGNFDCVATDYKKIIRVLPRVLGKNLPSILSKFGTVDLAGYIELTQKYINADVSLYRCYRLCIVSREYSIISL